MPVLPDKTPDVDNCQELKMGSQKIPKSMDPHRCIWEILQLPEIAQKQIQNNYPNIHISDRRKQMEKEMVSHGHSRRDTGVSKRFSP
jgi:hypothetical protein